MHDRLNLDGAWKMRRDPERTLIPADAVHDFSWENTALPAALPAGRGAVWFRRRFRVPAGWRGKSLFLYCGGAEHAPAVWVNGHPVGRVRSGRHPFELPVTAAIAFGRENALTIRAEYGPGTPGLWGVTALLARDTVSVAGVHTDACRQGEDALLTVRIRLRNADRQSRAVGVTCIADTRGSGMDAAVREHRDTTIEGHDAALTVMMRLPAPRLWHTHDRGEAMLHTLTVLVAERGRILDETQVPFGIRYMDVRADGRWLLNGRPLFIRGAVPDPAAFPVPERIDYVRDYVQGIRRAGFNALCVAAGYRGRELYRACDREGVLVWQGLEDVRPERDMRTFETVCADAVRMVRHRGSHPCVAAWFTDTDDGPVARAVRGADAGRPVLGDVTAARENGACCRAGFPLIALDGAGAGRRTFERLRTGADNSAYGCFCTGSLSAPRPSAAPVLITFEPLADEIAADSNTPFFNAVTVVNDLDDELQNAVCRVVLTGPDGSAVAEDVRTVTVPPVAAVRVFEADGHWNARPGMAPGAYRLTCALLGADGKPLARNGTVVSVVDGGSGADARR